MVRIPTTQFLAREENRICSTAGSFGGGALSGGIGIFIDQVTCRDDRACSVLVTVGAKDARRFTNNAIKNNCFGGMDNIKGNCDSNTGMDVATDSHGFTT